MSPLLPGHDSHQGQGLGAGEWGIPSMASSKIDGALGHAEYVLLFSYRIFSANRVPLLRLEKVSTNCITEHILTQI